MIIIYIKFQIVRFFFFFFFLGTSFSHILYVHCLPRAIPLSESPLALDIWNCEHRSIHWVAANMCWHRISGTFFSNIFTSWLLRILFCIQWCSASCFYKPSDGNKQMVSDIWPSEWVCIIKKKKSTMTEQHISQPSQSKQMYLEPCQ